MDETQPLPSSQGGMPVFGRSRAKSSSVALACATAFILFAGLLSFVGEPLHGDRASWLRSSLAPVSGARRVGAIASRAQTRLMPPPSADPAAPEGR